LYRLLVFVVFLIIYGSLYPWHFEARHLTANPAWILLHSRHWVFDRFFLRDLFINVALYIPLGLSGYLAFRRSKNPILRIGAPVLLGLVLSSALEMAQLFAPPRNCSLVDLVANVAGTAIGVAVALIFRETAERLTRRYQLERICDSGALALLLFWIAYQLFPIFPVIGRYILEQKVAVLAVAPRFSFVRFASATVCWFGAGLWLQAIGVRQVWKWLAVLLLIIPGQLFVAGRQPAPSDLSGAAAGCVCFALLDKSRHAGHIAAAGFLFLLLLHGLAPFKVRMEPNVFGWIPFAATLGSEWQFGAFVLVEKVFYYWAAIWALRSAGIRLRTATLIVAATVAAIEIAQIYLSGRTPEITDPILAVLIGVVLHLLDSRQHTRVAS
jgi:VanZ family protein